MNIPAINSVDFLQNIQPQKKSEYNTNFGLKMSAPLSRDSVSFCATPKQMGELSEKVSEKTLNEIEALAKNEMRKVATFMNKTFDEFVRTEDNPYGIISRHTNRIKSKESIREKISTLRLGGAGIQEIITTMTDINGAKIILLDSSKKSCNKIIGRIQQAVEDNKIIVEEIENKRPIVVKNKKSKYRGIFDYADEEALIELHEVAQKKSKGKPVKLDLNDYTKANYPAIHLRLRLHGSKLPFELQIMGYDVAEYKELDDILYKLLHGKKVDSKYAPIQQIMDKLLAYNTTYTDNKTTLENSIKYMKTTSKGQPEIEDVVNGLKMQIENMGDSPLEKFNKYRGDTFLFQRVRDTGTKGKKSKNDIKLPISKYQFTDNATLNKQLDMTYLYKLMKKCNDETI